MEQVLFQISQDNITWADIPIPSEYGLSYEDLDDESYRSKLTGNLIRRRISPRWLKLSMRYNFLSDSQLNTVARAINTNQKFFIRCKGPAFGNMGTDNSWVQFKAYCSHYEAEMLPLQSGWKVQFNIIQSDTSNFQE